MLNDYPRIDSTLYLFPDPNITEIIKAPAAVCLRSQLESIFETIKVLQVHINDLFLYTCLRQNKTKIRVIRRIISIL